jgi:hypothetical protein
VRLADRLAVEADRARARTIEARDETQQRGLAAARAADEGEDFAGCTVRLTSERARVPSA